MGSGPFKFLASERIPGQRVVYEKNDKYVARKDGKPSFNAGPKIVYIDRVVWNFIPDPATASAALTQREIDWWENPTIDLVPQLRRDNDLTLAVKDGPVRSVACASITCSRRSTTRRSAKSSLPQ